jgi:SpoIID/LytB domain protein
MPSSWPAAALQAQAVAARTYALVASASAPKASCGGCHLWDSTRSQVYTGWAKEAESSGSTRWGALWVAAVQATQTTATTSLTVLHSGRPVTTYYASSTGGRTRDSGDVWGTSLPYLASVTDPWSVDPSVNPRYARWTRTVTVPAVLKIFALPDLVSLKVTTRDASGAAKVLTATSSAGVRRTVSGNALTSGLGLPGAWITGIAVPESASRRDTVPGPLGRVSIGRS